MTAPEQLTAYLKSIAPLQVSSGELQRREWRNANGTIATPRSIVRRLQELAEEGTLIVETRKNHAYYSYGAPKRVKWEFDLVNGVRVARKTFV